MRRILLLLAGVLLATGCTQSGSLSPVGGPGNSNADANAAPRIEDVRFYPGQLPLDGNSGKTQLPIAPVNNGSSAEVISPTFGELSPILGLEDVTPDYYNVTTSGSMDYPIRGLTSASVGVALSHPDNFLNQTVIQVFVFESDDAAGAFFEKRATELEREITNSPFAVSNLERQSMDIGERFMMYTYDDIPNDSVLFGSLYHAEVLSKNGNVAMEVARISTEPDENLGPSLVQIAGLVFQKQGS